MVEVKEFTRQFRHQGRKRQDIKVDVMAAEREAEKELGGPVVRSHRFVNGGVDCVFIWRLAPKT